MRERGAEPSPKRPLVLVIDSNGERGAGLARLIGAAGYDVQTTPHERALHLLRDGHSFGAVILRAAAEPSTLSARDCLGEFVARYMKHVVPELLACTVVLTTLAPGLGAFPGTRAVMREPFRDDELLDALAACVGNAR